MHRGSFLLLPFLLLLLPALASGGGIHPASGPLTITPVSPTPGSATNQQTPNITAVFTDPGAQVEPGSVSLILDGVNVTGVQGIFVNRTQISYTPISILSLNNGNHTVTVTLADDAGHTAQYSWGFIVNTSLPNPPQPFLNINPRNVIIDVAIAAALAGSGVGGYIFYLQQTRRFTFRKYFALHPVKRQYVTLYIPLLLAFLFFLLGSIYVYGSTDVPAHSADYVVVLALFIALTPYAVEARASKRRLRTNERAFAQFLFEMSDAMRGGIDPAKAMIELSKTHTNVLRKPLRIAADAIRLGRPFDVVLRAMAAPMQSPLISRYAGLIAEASSVGGETALVVHRAAKDMDDFIKIEVERSNQLTLPVAILYVAFGVLMAVLFALLFIAPSLGSINVSFLTGGSPLQGASAAAGSPSSTPHLDPATLRERFYDLMLINSLGMGAIIGAFTEGRARYGLIHGLAMVAITTIAFAIIFP